MRITLLSAALLATGLATAATPVDGWYSSVFGGYTYLPANINNYTPIFIHRDGTGYGSGYNVGGRIGFQSNPLRYEAEYTFLRSSLKHFYINGIKQTNVTGYSAGNFIMANIYYDCPEMLPAISPYLGLGVGYGYLQANLSSLGPIIPTSLSITDSVFAYQGTAGITYNFSENYAVNLAYRYLATARPDNFGTSFQAHMATVGAIYRFDQGNYK